MSFATVLGRLARLENPFPGLRPFETNEAHLFFGRDQQVLDLLDRLARNRFVAVLGLSGSGKSSLIYAGLIPALLRGRLIEPGFRWRIASTKPRGAPFANLAASLDCPTDELRCSSHGLIEHARARLQPGEGLFVLIDQFEELFRYKDRSAAHSDPAACSEAAAFVELLIASTRSALPIYVVVTMRTDYLGDCAEFPDFPEVLNESQYLVPRLTREQRRQAIEGPLGAVRISSTLVERILNDAGDDPDQLPLLQHALMRTWSHWRKSSADSERPISIEDYDGAGGLDRALNRHAQELLDSDVARAEPRCAEVIFKRLTAVGRGNRERRDPAPLSELWELCEATTNEQRERVNDVIDLFRRGDATFLTPRDAQLEPDLNIDIVHESLIRNWDVLAQRWLPEEDTQSRTLIELFDRALGWRAGKRDVLMALDLAGALEWDQARNHSRKWAEHYAGVGAIEVVEDYLAASRKSFEESERRKAAAGRRTRIFAGILAMLLGVALYFVFIAMKQQRLAESRELAAISESQFSAGLHSDALNSAIRAASIENTLQAREAIARAFPQILAKLEGHFGRVLDARFSPDGKRLVTASDDKTALVWNAVTGELITKLEGHSAGVLSATFSSDGEKIVTTSDDRTARIWNAANGEVIAKLEGHSAGIATVAFSPDNQSVVTASVDGTARIWNAVSGHVIAELPGHSFTTKSAAFSTDGRRVITTSGNGTVRVWNAVTGEMITKLEGSSPILIAALSPDCRRVVLGGLEPAAGIWTARIWDVATRQVIATLEGRSLVGMMSAEFSPDGQRVVIVSIAGTASLWNATTGAAIAKLEGHSANVSRAVFSPDGRRVLTVSDDRTARVWNAATGDVIARLEGHSDRVLSAAFSPDGQRLVTASGDHTAQVWNIANGQMIAELDQFPTETDELRTLVRRPVLRQMLAQLGDNRPEITVAAFSPDGRRVITARVDRTACVWNAVTGQVMAKLSGHLGSVWSAGFSPDGRRVVTASADHTARVWNADSGREIAKLEGHSESVLSVAFSPDGERVTTASVDATSRVWNAATGKVICKLEGHGFSVLSAVFSPDGQRVVTASGDNTARVWNAATGKVICKLEGHAFGVRTAVFSPDGQRIVTASADNTARVWNAATGEVIAKLEGHSRPVRNAVFSRDGRRVVTASDDKTARIWNADSGEAIAKLEGHSAEVTKVGFSPDGQRLVTASVDHTARVWSASTGQVLLMLEGHSAEVSSVEFSPDGKLVVTASGSIARVFRILTAEDIDRLFAK